MKQGNNSLSFVTLFFTIFINDERWKIYLHKCRTFEEVKGIFGENNLIKLCNIKQIVQYAVMNCQPVWIDKGYNGKLIAYYYKPDTTIAWEFWKKKK